MMRNVGGETLIYGQAEAYGVMLQLKGSSHAGESVSTTASPLSMSGKTGLRRFLARYEPPETVAALGIAMLVGVGAGLGAIVFRWLIGTISQFAFTWLPQALSSLGLAYVVIAPALGGLLVGPLIYFFAREAKGHGVPEVMEAVALRGGRIRPIVVVVKSLASSITIGMGGSVGREGPIVQIGSAIGSTIGQVLRLSDDRIRNLVACGAAGGIAATFNAPIAGVFFALEVILGEFSAGNFGLVVVSSVMASVIGRAAFGDVPAFLVPEYALRSPWEFFLYVLLGVVAAAVAVLYTRSIYRVEDIFDRWKRFPEWLKAAIGGILLGLIALTYSRIPGLGFETVPQVYGVGYSTIERGLLAADPIWVVFALMFLKILSTAITVGSGGSGGIFAPGLFIGSMLGNGFGQVAGRLFPGIVAPAGAYSLVGMAALFAGATSAPITAVLILFEMTGDYRIILPLMLSVAVATFLGKHWLGGESIYTLKLSRRGVRLQYGRDVDVMQGVLVSEAMTGAPDTVSVDTTLSELVEEFNRSKHHGYPVLDTVGKLYGMLTLRDVEQALEADATPDTTAGALATTTLLVAYPDEPMSTALRRLTLNRIGRLPVVDRQDPKTLLGIVRRDDIIRAYNIALTRRAEVQHRAARLQLRNLDGSAFVEVEIGEDAPCVGRSIAELSKALPHEFVLVSIRREDGTIVIPHGDTDIRTGDRVTAFASSDAARGLRECLVNGPLAGDVSFG
jgi:chloride channel protein, CIC family